MPFYVYVIYSRNFDRLYKGQTRDIQNRLKEHNSVKVKSTRHFIPWEIIYSEEYKSRVEVIIRERYFKTAAGRRFIKSKIELRT